MSRRSFHVADYCVFAVSLLASMAIGLYFAFTGGRQKTQGEYLMGNRQLKLIPVSISMLVSVISANTLLGVPAEMYAFGINYWLLPIGLVPACIGVALTFVPLLHPLKLTSCYEYLGMRFLSPFPKQLGSILLIIKQMLYIGTVLFGPATALEAVSGLPAYASIIIVSLVATIYTALGGMKAVIWTDVFQSGIMLGGMLAVVIQGINTVGGIRKVFDINMEDKRIDFSNFMDFDLTTRYSFWSLSFGYFTYWMGEYGINQPTAQRYCALPTLTKARVAMILNGPGFAVIQTLSALAGITAYAYFSQKGCDPLSTGEISNANQVLPLFTMEVLGLPGLPGLMLACIFSGSLSTISSSLNSMAACVWEDFLKSRLGHLEESRITILIKTMVFVFGGIGMGMAFFVASLGGTMIQMATSFAGVSLGPMLGLFALGGIFTFTNAWGAVIGAVLGFAFPLWMLVGALNLNLQNRQLPGRTDQCYGNASWSTITPYTDMSTAKVLTTTPQIPVANLTGLSKFYAVSFAWYPLIGCSITFFVGIIISLVSGMMRSRDIPKEHLCCCVRKCAGVDDGEKVTWTSMKKDGMKLTQHMDYDSKDMGLSSLGTYSNGNVYQINGKT